MKKDILMVVDMINGFTNTGAMHDKNIESIIPNCVKYIEYFLEKGMEVIAFRDYHQIYDKEFELFPTHCLAGSFESELVEEIKIFQDQLKIVKKNTFNGFVAEEFQEIISKLNDYRNIVVTGCCTDICVIELVKSLMEHKKVNNLEYQVIVVSSACDTYDAINHNRKIYHSNALQLMNSMGAVIVEEYHE